MKKSLITLVLCALLFSISQAQNPDKIKGNRLVSIVNTEINSFHTIALDEDFKVDFIYNKIPSVEIETDENLHEFIEFFTRDSILYFNHTKKITSKKKLNIKVMYDDFLQHFQTTDKSELNGLTPIDLTNGTLNTSGSSKVALTLKTDNFNFEGSDKSKVKLNLTADSCTVTMRGSSKIEALINAPKILGSLKDKSSAIIEGNCDTADLELDDNSQFNGKNFTLTTCNIISNTSSDAYLEVIKDVTIDATGSSAIYLYQNPKITINKMTDTSKLQKKVK
jgi:hypothetical protein